MERDKLQFTEQLFVRLPARPYHSSVSVDLVQKNLEQADFLLALYLASPGLYQVALHWQKGLVDKPKHYDHIVKSLAKYCLRMATRCTPFGVFAGVALLPWGGRSSIVYANTSKIITRLDIKVLEKLLEKLVQSTSFLAQLKYLPNNSIYKLNKQLRYVEPLAQGGYQLSTIQKNSLVTRILSYAKGGKSLIELENFLLNDGYSQADAHDFICGLVENNLIISSLSPSPSGQSLQEKIYHILLKNIDAGFGKYIEIFEKVAQLNVPTKSSVHDYRSIDKNIEDVLSEKMEASCFHCDLGMSLTEGAALDTNLKQQLFTVIELLAKRQNIAQSEKLTQFAEKYTERYGDQELSLAFALDAELGLGYPINSNNESAALLDGLELGAKDGPIQIEPNDGKILKLLAACQHTQQLEISLLDVWPEEQPIKNIRLPPSFNIFFRLLAQDKIYIDHIGGASALSALARFAPLDDRLHQQLKQIVQHEERQNPAVIFAEILHLPNDHTGNVLQHEQFRAYEIPYLSPSYTKADKQLAISDIYVSVKAGQIFLKSKKLNKYIIPRLSNAHNYNRKALPLYQFLCDLQHQNITSKLSFSWGKAAEFFKFLPRVVYKNTIVHAATWQLASTDWAALLNHTQNIEAFLQSHHLPESFLLVQDDNELPIDTSNPMMVEIFKDLLKNESRIVLKEAFEYTESVHDLHGLKYANQFVAPILNFQEVYSAPAIPKEKANFEAKDWLYLKIYTGTKSADEILLRVIAPLIKLGKKEGLVDRWFFIRYADPDHHLRLRLHIQGAENQAKLMAFFHSVSLNFSKQKIIWRIQTDQYQPEWYRYSIAGMEPTERLFQIDSEHNIALLQYLRKNMLEEQAWIAALYFVDILLEAFGSTLAQKQDLSLRLKEKFAEEFLVDKSLRLHIDKKYRQYKEDIYQFKQLHTGILNKYRRKIKPVVTEILALPAFAIEDKSQYLASLVHMQINRCVPAMPRAHELLLYDFLYKMYSSEQARKR